MTRRFDVDHLRCAIVLMVMVHHVVCLFNCAGVPMNLAPGIPALDAIAYFCYPWLMPCMFLLAGRSARYALEEQSARQFLARRVRRLLVPFFAGAVLLGLPLVQLTFAVKGGSVGEMLAYFPSPLIGLFFLCMMGMGPQWFLLALFFITLLFLPLRALDRRDRFWAFCGKAGMPALLALWAGYWAFSQIGNAVDRYPLYLLLFLAGYWIFSYEDVAARLARAHLPLLGLALGLYLWVLARWYGRSFAGPPFVSDLPVTLFGWAMTLAAVGCAKAWGDRETAFSRFWRRRSFALYQFHYLLLTAAVCAVTRLLHLPAAVNYLLSLALAAAGSLGLYELLSRVPGVRSLFALPPPGP